MERNSKKNELKRRIFALQKVSVNRCLEPSETCEGPAIRAHSIQNSVILDQFCFNGHVIMPRSKMRSTGPDVSFGTVGRNEATTFTGLCGTHDQAIFAPVDIAPIDVRNNEHLFLLAYRSVLRELHASMTAAVKTQHGVQERIELGLVRGDVPSRDELIAVDHMVNSYNSYEYKRKYDLAFSEKKFGRIQHVQFFEPDRSPSSAVSALFSLDHIMVGDDVARVALNVFPSTHGAMIIFSFLREHALQIRPFMRPFKKVWNDRLLEMVSVPILNWCENFVILPNSWSKGTKERWSRSFPSTRRDSAKNF